MPTEWEQQECFQVTVSKVSCYLQINDNLYSALHFVWNSTFVLKMLTNISWHAGVYYSLKWPVDCGIVTCRQAAGMLFTNTGYRCLIGGFDWLLH